MNRTFNCLLIWVGSLLRPAVRGSFIPARYSTRTAAGSNKGSPGIARARQNSSQAFSSSMTMSGKVVMLGANSAFSVSSRSAFTGSLDVDKTKHLGHYFLVLTSKGHPNSSKTKAVSSQMHAWNLSYLPPSILFQVFFQHSQSYYCCCEQTSIIPCAEPMFLFDKLKSNIEQFCICTQTFHFGYSPRRNNYDTTALLSKTSLTANRN